MKSTPANSPRDGTLGRLDRDTTTHASRQHAIKRPHKRVQRDWFTQAQIPFIITILVGGCVVGIPVGMCLLCIFVKKSGFLDPDEVRSPSRFAAPAANVGKTLSRVDEADDEE